ncbi:hypothetical protein FRB99_003093 [Tulasnella sp. 403]|nr:hypothetical protein FRB99_003093 [Tulasnella sp. 403]
MSALLFLLLAAAARAQYSATYSYDPSNPSNLPDTTEQGQAGTNRCGGGSSQTSLCQNVFMNSITDFCVWGPPYSNGQNATVGETEREEVAFCLKSGYGTRLLPDGTITGAHWVQTPDYVQVTGIGDFTKIGIPASDSGGELDPHGADGNGNPIGGLVFGNSYGGSYIQYHEWTNFMSSTEFCIRACKPGPNAAALCQHIYDLQGCHWNMPGNYDGGYFESCFGDTGLPMGVYGSSTWQQGTGPTPDPHPAPPSSSCVRVASLTSYSPLPTASYSTSVTIVTSGSAQFTYLASLPPSSSQPTTAPSTTKPSVSPAPTSTQNAARKGQVHRPLLLVAITLASLSAMRVHLAL